MARLKLIIGIILISNLVFCQSNNSLIIEPSGDQQRFCLINKEQAVSFQIKVPANYCKIVSYKIEWQDGDEETFDKEIPTSTVQQVIKLDPHVYADTAFFKSCAESMRIYVNLIATLEDGCNQSNEDTYPLTFLNIAKPKFKVKTICISQKLQMDNESCPSKGLSYQWENGNGQSSKEAQPTFSYDKAGIYTIKLTADNTCETPVSTTQTITVIKPAKSIISDSGSVRQTMDSSFICLSFGDTIRLIGDGSENENLDSSNKCNSI
jgi:hypothetical protein